MTAPSIKEALKPCPFCGGEAQLCQGIGGLVIQCKYEKCNGTAGPAYTEDQAAEIWNNRAALATFQPDGERREAIKALAHRFWSIHPSEISAKNLTREEFYEREMTKLLASGLVQNEAYTATLEQKLADAVRDNAAIRADEREKCAKIAENHSFLRGIEWWMTSTKKDVSAESCHSVASAIRSARDGG